MTGTSPEVFGTLSDLLTLMTRPTAYKSKLAALKKQIDRVESASAKFEAASQAHAAKVAADKAEMAEREAAVKAREVRVMIAENELCDRQKALDEAGRPWRPERVEALGNGLTRELE